MTKSFKESLRDILNDHYEEAFADGKRGEWPNRKDDDYLTQIKQAIRLYVESLLPKTYREEFVGANGRPNVDDTSDYHKGRNDVILELRKRLEKM